MPAVWTYPWGLYSEGVEEAVIDLSERGIDTLSLATHYHSVRSLQPRTMDDLFDNYSGGCYFNPDSAYFEGNPIKPIQNQVDGHDDPLDDICRVANRHGLSVNAWTVCLHNSQLGSKYPDYQIEDVFGNAHEHAFCPSNEVVREYFAAVAQSIADYPVKEIELESVGFPSVFHGHDTSFGHEKRQVLTSPTEELLFSQCFCDACQAEAADRVDCDVDMDTAQDRIQSIIEDSFQLSHTNSLSLNALVQEYKELQALFDFRAEIITDLLKRIATRTDDVMVNYYVMDGFGVDPGDGWPAGVQLERAEQYLNRVTAICYVNDPTVARERLHTLKRMVDLPIDAGVTLDPEIVDSAEEFYTVMAAVKAELTGDVTVYHHTLATETQLDWIEAAVSNWQPSDENA